MKKLIAYPATWALYYLGDAISRLPRYNYNIYNNLMTWSVSVQDWANLKTPWEHVNDNETN